MWDISKKQAYVVLAFSIACELVGSYCIEASEQFTKPVPTIILIISYYTAFSTFSKILHLINLAIAYATWSAVGSIASSLIVYIFFDKPLSIIGWVSMIVMSVGVFLLNLYGAPTDETGKEKQHLQQVSEVDSQ